MIQHDRYMTGPVPSICILNVCLIYILILSPHFLLGLQIGCFMTGVPTKNKFVFDLLDMHVKPIVTWVHYTLLRGFSWSF
jgi:hypothetical protein